MTNLKRRIFAVGIIVLLFTVWLGRLSPEAGTEQETEAFYTDADVSVLSNPVPQQIIVHVAGAVAEPGVYQLQEGQRVEDALQLAGVVEDSDLDALNRAALLTDGQKIVVPSVQEAEQTASGTTAVNVIAGDWTSKSSGNCGLSDREQRLSNSRRNSASERDWRSNFFADKR